MRKSELAVACLAVLLCASLGVNGLLLAYQQNLEHRLHQAEQISLQAEQTSLEAIATAGEMAARAASAETQLEALQSERDAELARRVESALEPLKRIPQTPNNRADDRRNSRPGSP